MTAGAAPLHSAGQSGSPATARIPGELYIGRIFAFLSFWCFLLNGTAVRSEYVVFASAGFGGLALIAMGPRLANLPHYYKWMMAILFLAIFLVMFKVTYYPVAFTFLAVVPAGMAVALYIEAFPKFFRVRWVLYASLAYFYVAVLLLGVSAEIVFAGSRNQISVLFLSLGVLVLVLDTRREDVILAIVIFWACVLSVGSGGIVAGLILMAAVVFRQNSRAWIKAAVFFFAIMTVVGLQIYILYYAPPEFVTKFSLERLTGTDPRFQIIASYADRYLTGDFLLLGAPDDYAFYTYSEISSGGIWAYVNSLHNSYLSVHAKVGILALGVFALIAKVLWALRGNLFHAMLFTVLLVRAFADSVYILDGYYNFAFYFFFILASHAHAARQQRSPGFAARAMPLPAPARSP